MEKKYNIFFTGTAHEHVSLEQLKQNLARLFKTDPAKVEKLFQNKAVLIKKNLTAQQLEKYQQVLYKAGAKIKVSAAVNETAPSVKTEASESSAINSALQGLISYNQSAQPVAEARADEEQGLQLLPANSGSMEQFAQHPEFIMPDLSGYQLEQAGTGSLEEFARQVVAVEIKDISYMDITDKNERHLSDQTPKPAAVAIPQTDHLSLAESHQGSLEQFAKQHQPLDDSLFTPMELE